MRKNMARKVMLTEYVREILQSAKYMPGEDCDCIIAFAEALPGCMTQGDTYEGARELLIDAIELWVLSAIKDGDKLPIINGCELAVSGSSKLEAMSY
jgi:predicted RNase H-like HicB family nuclease